MNAGGAGDKGGQRTSQDVDENNDDENRRDEGKQEKNVNQERVVIKETGT